MPPSAKLDANGRPDRKPTIAGTANVLRRHMMLAAARRRRVDGHAPDKEVQAAAHAALRDWVGAGAYVREVRVEPFDRAAPPFEVGAALAFGEEGAAKAFILMCPDLVRRAANARLNAVGDDAGDALTSLDAWLAAPLARAALANLLAAVRRSNAPIESPGAGDVVDAAGDPRLDASEVFVLTISAAGDAPAMRLAIAAPALIEATDHRLPPDRAAGLSPDEARFDRRLLDETLGLTAAICVTDARLGDVVRLRVGQIVRLVGADAGCVRLYPAETPEAAISIGEIGAARGKLGFRIRAICATEAAPSARAAGFLSVG